MNALLKTINQQIKSNWQLSLILITALVMRLWGIDFGLPYAYHVDEPRYISSAIAIWQTSDLNPGWFHQPSLYTYLVTAVMGLYYLTGWLSGQFATTADLFRPPYHFDGFIPLPGEFLSARLLTALFGVLTVWLVYYAARRWMSREGALAAAAFLTLSIFHATSSHFIATDVPVAFFIVAALFFCGRIAETGQGRSYIFAGIFIGLAAGTKYSAYTLVVPAGLAHLFAWRSKQSPLFSLWPILLGASAAATFVLTTPYAILDYSTFIEGIQYEWLHHKVIGHIGAEGESGRWLLTQLLTRSDRWLSIAAFAGFVVAMWRRQQFTLIVLSFSLAYFISMASNIVRFERFLVPLIPALALAAGYFFSELTDWLKPQQRRRALIVGLLVLLEPAVSVSHTNYLLAQADVRTLAREWMKENIPPGASIIREGFAPSLQDEPYIVHDIQWLNEHPADWYREQGFDYLVFAKARYGVLYRDPERYAEQIKRYEILFEQLEPVARFEGPYVGRPDHDIRIYKPRP